MQGEVMWQSIVQFKQAFEDVKTPTAQGIVPGAI